MDIFGILQMIGGLALFLYGMHVMGEALTKLSGGKLEQVLEKFTSTPFKAVILGAGTTAVIQSSSAATVMVVGFVNSGIMKLEQAAGIIMGANIGTTITSWFLSLTGIEGDNLFIKLLKPSSFTPVLAIIGVSLILFSKYTRFRDIGTILVGFSVLMYGMDTMSGAVKPLADVPEFTRLFTLFENPILGVIAGAVLTAVIQSSSAAIGILQALCRTGVVTYSSAVPIIMGQNIGTCITALLSGVGANKNAKRAALVHFYFNLIGTVLFMAAFYLLNAVMEFAFLHQAASVAGIAVVHSCFNIAAAVVLVPYRNGLVRLATLTIPDTEGEENVVPPLLDERFLERPSFAVAQAKRAALQMSEASYEAFRKSVRLFAKYNKDTVKQVAEIEETVDKYEDEIGTYLMRIGNAELTQEDSQTVSLILHCIGDFERISDLAYNLAETAKRFHSLKERFSDKAKAELKVYEKALRDIVEMTFESYAAEDAKRAVCVEPLEEVINTLNDEIKVKHVKRLRKGKCTIELGFVLSDMITHYERIADHCSNIAVCLIQTKEDGYEMHEYLDKLKEDTDFSFKKQYKEYRKKYKLPS